MGVTSWKGNESPNNAFQLTSSLKQVTEECSYQFLEVVDVELQIDNKGLCRIMKWTHSPVVRGHQIRMQSLFAV